MKRLFTICLVLLLCASVYGTPVGRSNIATAVADVQTDTTALIQLAADQLAQINNAGNVFYVDSSATGSGTGTSWTNATITIDLGIGKCAADNGDVLLVAPGHAETFTAANDADADKAGLRIFGLGVGENRPTLTYTANGEFVFGADDVEIDGFNFIAGNAVVHAIDVEAGFENFVINNCRFWTTTVGTDEFIDCIDIAAGADNGRITNNRVEMGAASAVSFVTNVGADYTEIADNTIDGDFSTACIVDVTTASIWLNIHDNSLINGTVGGTAGLNAVACISLKADTSARITDNCLFSAVTTITSAIVAADGFLSGNTLSQIEGSFLEVGKIYTLTKVAVVTGSTDALFLVAGGPIEIVSMFGNVTTIIASTPGNVSINLNSTNDAYDSDLSIVVALADGSEGDTVVFGALTNSENAGVLTANESASIPLSWFISVGSIEQTLSGTGTGAVTWYMTFRPLTTGVTVTVQ